jgi:hypothetical protein
LESDEARNLYHWSGETPMALNTSVCFAINGLALYLISVDCERRIPGLEIQRELEQRVRTRRPPYGFRPKDAIAAMVIIACSAMLIAGVSVAVAAPALGAVVIHYFSDPRLKG